MWVSAIGEKQPRALENGEVCLKSSPQDGEMLDVHGDTWEMRVTATLQGDTISVVNPRKEHPPRVRVIRVKCKSTNDGAGIFASRFV